MVKLPPAANVPPIVRLPLARAPVENEILPKLEPVISPPPLSPLTAINVEPPSERPLLLPDSVPPEFVKSMLLLAKAANGRASASTASKTSFLTMYLLPPRKVPNHWPPGDETIFWEHRILLR